MARAGLKGVTGRPRWKRAHPDLISTDLVDRQFAREGMNELWITNAGENTSEDHSQPQGHCKAAVRCPAASGRRQRAPLLRIERSRNQRRMYRAAAHDCEQHRQ